MEAWAWERGVEMTAGEAEKTPAADASRWRLVLTFLVVLGGMNLVYYAEKKLNLGVLDAPYTQLVTWTAGHTAALVLPYAITVGKYGIVAGGRSTILIASGCNGLEAIFLMVAGIMAYPAPWRRRWGGLVRYVPLLYLLNLIRVVFLVHIAHMHHDYLDISHYQIAQGVLIVFVLFFWINYIRGTTT
jgi:exosortase/archaeosortase family protein